MTASTAGYSGTPLHRKLGIKPEMRVLAVGVPTGWDLTQLDPDGTATVQTRAGRAPYDVAVAFCADSAAMRRRIAELRPRVIEKGRTWICWPKKASGVPTDLDDNVIREFGLSTGLVDVKVCAVDHTWSGLCFMTRLRDRTA